MGVEEVGTEICVVDAVAHDVPGGDQDVLSESDFGAFVATPAGQPSISCRQIRVFSAGGGGRGLAEGPRSHRSLLRVRPEKCLPADSLLPGHMPAQDASCCGVGNRLMSAPVSAIRFS